MAINATLKASLVGGGGPFVWILKITPAGSSPIYLGAAGYNSSAIGKVEPRVIQWGNIKYAWSDRSGSMQTVETEVVISDADRAYSIILEGSQGHTFYRAPAVIYVAHPGTATLEPMFTGIVEGWDYPSLRSIRFSLRVDDLSLRQSIPAAHWKISPYDWRSAPAASWNKYAPILFGSWSQNDYTNTGAVPLILVDPTNDLWLVCAGNAKAVNRVYVNGTTSSNWTKQLVTRGGKWFTVVDWSSTPPADGDTVTADVEGLMYPGTTDMIETPVNQMMFLLSNFVFDQYKAGELLDPNHPRIDGDAKEIVGDYVDLRGYRSARRVAEETSGYDQLAAWHRSHEFCSAWNPLGQIAFGIESWDVDYYDALAADVSRHERDFRIEIERDSVLSSVTFNYLQNAAVNAFQNSITCADQRAMEISEESVGQLWGAAS